MSDKSPFPAGFERDGRLLLLALDMKAISLATFQHNFKRLGVEFPPEPRALPTPPLERPSIHEEPQGEFYEIEGDPDHVVDIHTNAVFNVHTGAHVGFLQEPEDDDEVLELMAGEAEDVEPLGPPPEGAEFDDPDSEGIARPNPDDDEQVTTEVPE